MQHSPFWNMNRFSASQEVSCTKWKVQNHIYKHLLPVPKPQPWQVSLQPQHAASGCRWRNSLQICTAAANSLNKQLQTADKGLFSNLGLGEVLTTPHSKKLQCCKTLHKACYWQYNFKTSSTVTTRSVINSTLLSVWGVSIKLNNKSDGRTHQIMGTVWTVMSQVTTQFLHQDQITQTIWDEKEIAVEKIQKQPSFKKI